MTNEEALNELDQFKASLDAWKAREAKTLFGGEPNEALIPLDPDAKRRVEMNLPVASAQEFAALVVNRMKVGRSYEDMGLIGGLVSTHGVSHAPALLAWSLWIVGQHIADSVQFRAYDRTQVAQYSGGLTTLVIRPSIAPRDVHVDFELTYIEEFRLRPEGVVTGKGELSRTLRVILRPQPARDVLTEPDAPYYEPARYFGTDVLRDPFLIASNEVCELVRRVRHEVGEADGFNRDKSPIKE